MNNNVLKFDSFINENVFKAKGKEEPNISELKKEIARVLNQKVAVVNPDQHTGDWKKSERGKTMKEILDELSSVISDFRKK